jgi:hypothetical protein
MSERNRIDRLLAAEMTGPDKIAALLKARGFTLTGFARHISRWPEEVRMTVGGARPYPEIRDAMASELGLTREEIDELIDGPKAPAADEGGALSRACVAVPA